MNSTFIIFYTSIDQSKNTRDYWVIPFPTFQVEGDNANSEGKISTVRSYLFGLRIHLDYLILQSD